MHNYFVAFTYIDNTRNKNIRKYDNCIMVDTTDTATATASQLDDLVTRFTSQIKQQLGDVDNSVFSVVILNINKMN